MKLCNTDSCNRPVRARNLCSSHYEKDLKASPPQTLRHALSEINLTAKTGVCSQCGPETPIRVEKERTRCAIARRAASKRSGATYLYGDGMKVSRAAAHAARTRFYSEQKGRCAICTRTEEEVGSTFHLDHCHDTGELRGLLCVDCNIGLGRFKDSPENLKAASEYLTR